MWLRNSSVVERPAPDRLDAGSSPAFGAARSFAGATGGAFSFRRAHTHNGALKNRKEGVAMRHKYNNEERGGF